jgi:Cellulose biosynthesis GIL
MLNRSQAVGLTHSLLRLPLLSRVAHLDALHACRAQRDGDVLTADQDALYVFFFACGEADVEAAMQRLCVLPLDNLFSSMVSDISTDNMHKTLRKLRQAAWRGLPDYSRFVGVSAAIDAAPPADAFEAPAELPCDLQPEPGAEPEAHPPPLQAAPMPLPARQPQVRPQAIARHSTLSAVPSLGGNP